MDFKRFGPVRRRDIGLHHGAELETFVNRVTEASLRGRKFPRALRARSDLSIL